jgi:hypothetical protein
MIKLMYLAKRKPGFTRDGFVKRWRRHGALGMSTAFWRHVLVYVQAEPLSPEAMPGASGDYDALAYLSCKDEAFSQAPTPEDNKDTEMMLKDEQETFEIPTPNVSLWLQEHVLKSDEPGGVAAYLFFNDAAKARGIAEHYSAKDFVKRVVFNARQNNIELGGFKPIYPYQAVVEVSAPNLVTLKNAMGADSNAWWRDADLAVATREAVLWDRQSRF